MKLAISISSPSTQALYHGHQSLATFVSIFMVTIAYRHHALIPLSPSLTNKSSKLLQAREDPLGSPVIGDACDFPLLATASDAYYHHLISCK